MHSRHAYVYACLKYALSSVVMSTASWLGPNLPSGKIVVPHQLDKLPPAAQKLLILAALR